MPRRSSLLLDTHIILWWLAGSERLPEKLVRVVTKSEVPVYFSSVSVAEMAIKSSIGKLEMPGEYLSEIRKMGLVELVFKSEHAVKLRSLPMHHKDPFDRMLIVQAMVEGLTIMSLDPVFEEYGVRVVK